MHARPGRLLLLLLHHLQGLPLGPLHLALLPSSSSSASSASAASTRVAAMGWVDLDLNLPPPVPDPDGNSPPPSPMPSPAPARNSPLEASSLSCPPSSQDVSGRQNAKFQFSERLNDGILVSEPAELDERLWGSESEAERPGRVGREVVDNETTDMQASSCPSPSPSSHFPPVVSNVTLKTLIPSAEQGILPEQEERLGDSNEEEEDERMSRVRARNERIRAAKSACNSEPESTSILDDSVQDLSGSTSKPVRKRLRTLGQLRNQKVEKDTAIASPSGKVMFASSTPETMPPQLQHDSTASNMKAARASEGEGMDDGKAVNCSSNVRLERFDTAVAENTLWSKQPLNGDSGHQDEKAQSEDEGLISEMKAAADLKNVVSEKRRRSIVVLGAEIPAKRPRLPRSQPVRRNRSFGGVIVGERLEDGNQPISRISKSQSSKSTETKAISSNVDKSKQSILSADSLCKESTPEEHARAVDQDGDVEMVQQVELELGEVGRVFDEKQEKKPPKDLSNGTNIPKRPRKIKEGPTSSNHAPRSGKPPPAVKLTEFIRPTVKKQLGLASLRRQPSEVGQASRNDLRSPFQDTSIERLQREATCSKLWQSPGDSELQHVPGSFSSVDEYAEVFEPLLFEECRAQLHNCWEELLEGTNFETHAAVAIKTIERRERGWYDVVLMPMDSKRPLHFKEGDVAVLSTPKPGAGAKRKGRLKGGKVESAEEGQIAGRVAGLVRRFVPVDVRDPYGAIFHFHVSQEVANKQSAGGGESITDSFHTLQQLQQGGVWYMTGLGSFTTTQREYSALHQLPNFRPQMMNAILQPRPELFPGFADMAPPAMPDCFTSPFIQHLHTGFNTPQLAAIQWAAAHTAAGTPEVGNTAPSGGQPWPFTLVQGPPGTGKTHTVWGMLNVIHLVQYQRYYAALLKKLAPGSLATPEDSSSSNAGDYEGDSWGTIDEVLQKMDRNLARVLPKLCPKPRMLVCAPSNAATDELLSRVLDRGFIDGEMKVYRPDVARVGVDTSSRAAQAVSVERRTEQLLAMGQPQVVGWLQQLRTKEVTLAQHVAGLQKDLIDTAASARSQGNVGIEPEVLAARDQMRDGKLQQLAAVVEERDKVLVEMSRLFIIEVKFRPGSNFRPEDARRKLEASFANEAEIVFTTVSSSGRKIFGQLAHGFDMVVIDEAAQASEVAVLPPLSLRAARCVLVGDPQQLPATVISRAADTMKYSRSLFERFQQAGCPAILLSVQYRMHPQIRDFPSRYFYQGRLADSESVKGLSEEIYHKDPLLQPYLFFDISLGRESHGGSVSYQNKMEAQVAIQLYQHLQKVLAGAAGDRPPTNVSVGIITPYKQQLQCLEKEFVGTVGSNSASKGVYINTVDAFQGQERDVIVMSCVRASCHGVGFVADIRRMNVALTRARRSLWVIGNASALVQSEDWSALLTDARQRGCFISSATCIQQGLLPEPPMASMGGPPLGSPGLLQHPRGGGSMSRGRGMGLPYGGRHFLPGRHHFGNRSGDGSHWRTQHQGGQPGTARGEDGRELWQRPGVGRSCRGQRDGSRPGFGPTFQHPGRRSKGL